MLNLKPLYRLGRVIMTPKARARVSRKDIAGALQSHVRSFEGRPDENHGPRGKPTSFTDCQMLTAHRSDNGTRFWVISESDQALTQVMLPEEYGNR